MPDTSVFPVLLAGFGVLVGFLGFRNWMRGSGNIPGPLGWPLLGYLPYLGPMSLYKTMDELMKKYGPVFKIKMGSFDTVVITDYALIKKAFRNENLSSRPPLMMFEILDSNERGLVSSSGHLWNEQRRFALRHLRDLGMGKSSIEVFIQQEAESIISRLKKSEGQPIDLNNSLNIAITNIVWAIVAGRRMDYDDPVFLGFMAAFRRNMELTATVGALGFIPWLPKILPDTWTGVSVVKKTVDEITTCFQEIVNAHKETFDSNDLRDYADHFIDEQAKQQGKHTSFTDPQLIASMIDLFVAGGETTATTLRWAVLLISHYPEIQRKLHEEIDSVVGKDRRPTFEDRERMPYTDAVIHEVQRFSDIAPMGVFHSSTEEVQLEQYTIPKDTMIMGYVGGIHRSEKYWKKPNEFYPENFLDENGLLRKNVEGFLPFSSGKRQCIGENLARSELFVFVSYFFQSFSFKLCQDPKPSLDGDPAASIVRWPSPFKVVLESR